MFFFFNDEKKARRGRLGAVKARKHTNYPFTSAELATATGAVQAAMLGRIADTAVRAFGNIIGFDEFGDARQTALLWMYKYSVPKLNPKENCISYCYFAAYQAVKRFCKLRLRSRMNDTVGGADYFHDREALNDEEPEF